MSENNHHIDNFFRKGLADLEKVPPEEVWRRIDSQMEGRKRKAIAMNFLRIAAAVLILIGFGGGLMQLLRQNEEDNYLSADYELTIPLPDIADMPETRQIPPSSDFTFEGNEEKATLKGTGESPAEEITGLEIGLTAMAMATEIRNPELPGQITARSATMINYFGHEIDLIPPSVYKPVHHDQSGKSRNKQGRWTAGVMVAPGYAFRSLSSTQEGGLNKTLFNTNESGILAFSGRVNISYNINERFSVKSGIDYMKMGQNLQNLYVFTEPSAIEKIRNLGPEFVNGAIQPVNNSLGEIETTMSSILVANTIPYRSTQMLNDFQSSANHNGNNDQTRIIQELYYLQAPLLIQYRILNGNPGVLVSGGIGASFLTGNNVLLKYSGNSIELGKTLGVKNFSLTGIAGLSVEHNITERTVFTVEPGLTYFISPVNEGASLRLRPWSVSVYGGLCFRF